MQHKFIRELVEFKFKAIRTATKKAKPTSTISDKEKDELAKWLKNQNN